MTELTDYKRKIIEKYFGVTVEYIEAVLRELEKANGDSSKLILTEQFNLGYAEGMKDAAKSMDKYFQEFMTRPIEDFKEVDPNGNVVTIEDIVVTDQVTDTKGNQ